MRTTDTALGETVLYSGVLFLMLGFLPGVSGSTELGGIAVLAGVFCWAAGALYLIVTGFRPMARGPKHELIAFVAWSEVLLLTFFGVGLFTLLAYGSFWNS